MTTDTKAGAPLVTLHRWEEFCAAHRLYDDRLSKEENEALYGPCAREYGHGHNYRIGVSVKGAVNPRTGMVVNLVEIKKTVQELIVDDMDHRNLNHDSKLLKGINPTAENIVVKCWEVLHAVFGDLLEEVIVEETPRNSVSYRGERVK